MASKLMAFRFEPGMGTLLGEIAGRLTKSEIRQVTKTEVVERAVAVYYSLLMSDNIAYLDSRDIQPIYRQSLAVAKGLSKELPGA